MTNFARKFVQILTTRINKSPVLTNVIEAASERAQVQFANMQNVATKKYDTIVKQVNGATIIQDLKSAALEPSTPMPKQLVVWWKWYQQLTGLDDVEVARQQMINVQDKLFDCRKRRRDFTNESSAIADKLKEVYAELVQTRREDPKYVQLTIMENKALQDQSRIMSHLHLLENEERDYFTQLATAIKEYHDSQNMNAQKYKYLSILASAVIAIISLGGSMIYNNKRIAEVHKVLAAGQEKSELIFRSYFDVLKSSVDEIKSDYKNIVASNNRNNNNNNNNNNKNNNIPNDAFKYDTSLHSPLEKKIIIGSAFVFIIYLLSKVSS